MAPAEGRPRLRAHLPAQHRRVDRPQVHQDEAVDAVGECGAAIECEHAAAETQEMTQQRRHPLAVRLETGDQFREPVDAARAARVKPEGAARQAGAERPFGANARGQRIVAAGAQNGDPQLAGERLILAAEADRPDQPAVAGIAAGLFGDALPEKHQGGEALLVFQAHERAAELERGTQQPQEQRAVIEQRRAVEPLAP